MKTRSESRSLTCGICLHSIEFQGALNSCRHEFCYGCILKWSKIENRCPVCKSRYLAIKRVGRRKEYKAYNKPGIKIVRDKTQEQRFVPLRSVFLSDIEETEEGMEVTL